MARKAFVLVVSDPLKGSCVSIAVSSNRERIERLADRLRLLPMAVFVLEASSLDEDAEEAAVLRYQKDADVHVGELVHGLEETQRFWDLYEADRWGAYRSLMASSKKRH